MKKIVIIALALLMLVACGGSKVPVVNEDGKLTQVLDNGLEVTINDKRLVDAYGGWYADEAGAILVLDVKAVNTSKDLITFGGSAIQLIVDEEIINPKLVKVDKDRAFEDMVNLNTDDISEGDIIFPSLSSYTKENDVFLRFFNPLTDEETGKIQLDLVGVIKEVSKVTARPEESKEGEYLVCEMEGISVKVGNPIVMTDKEFKSSFPTQTTLGLREKYRYLIVDVAYTNGTDEELPERALNFWLEDNFGDRDVQKPNAHKDMGDEALNPNEPIPPQTTVKGKIGFILADDVTHVQISVDPIRGVNSEFLFDFDVDVK